MKLAAGIGVAGVGHLPLGAGEPVAQRDPPILLLTADRAELEPFVGERDSLGVQRIGRGGFSARCGIQHAQRAAIAEPGGKQWRWQAILANAHGERAEW